MIDIKEFNVGDTVYIERDCKKDILNKAIVIKVGRKYVTVMEHGWKSQYGAKDYEPDALIEKTEIGSPSLLFKSEKSYRDYKESKQLEIWLRKEFGGYQNKNYTLEQLRNVKAILEGRDVYHTFPVPPCKVGGIVYEVQELYKRVQEYEVVSVLYSNSGFSFGWNLKDGKGVYSNNVLGFTDIDIGKTVFLTKEEAEKALAERNKP